MKETQQVMLHEEAHIRQGHSYDTLLMNVLKVIAWFHPLVYLYDRALTQTHEYAADAAVLQQTTGANYARLLSKQMLTGRSMLPVHYFFRSSQTLDRIHMIYTKNTRTPWYRYVLIAPVFASLFLTFACEPDAEQIRRAAVEHSYETVQDNIAQIDQQLQNNPSPSEQARLESERDVLRKQLTQLPDAHGVYAVVEDMPEPTNGMEEFYRFVMNNMQYPKAAREANMEGRVFIQFVVDETGELTQAEVLKGIGRGCDEEALRIIKESPAWNPGLVGGQAVKTRMVMPISFKMGDDKSLSELLPDAIPRGSKPLPIKETVIVGYQ